MVELLALSQCRILLRVEDDLVELVFSGRGVLLVLLRFGVADEGLHLVADVVHPNGVELSPGSIDHVFFPLLLTPMDHFFLQLFSFVELEGVDENRIF